MTDQNLSNFKGETAEKKITFTDDDGNSIDLDSGTVTQVYLTVSTGTHQYGEQVFEKNPSQIEDNNIAIFKIDSSDTVDLRPGNYIFEAWLEYNDGSNYTAEVGKYFLKKRVDR